MKRCWFLLLLLFSLLCSMGQNKDSLIAINNAVIGKQYKTQAISHVSVHDPSIVIDNTGTKKTYYVYGSHLATGKSANIKDWSGANLTFSSSSPYRVNAVKKVKILKGSETIEADFGSYNAEQWRYTEANPNIGGNQWAPDVVWNPNMNKWCMYMSLNGDNWRSVIVLLTSDKVGGPYTYQGPVVFSGFQWDDLPNQTWRQTDIKLVPGLQDITSLPSRYLVGSNWGRRYPNCIDPCVFFDDNGQMWMSYGSWSGGIYILKLDKSTGLRDYTVKYSLQGSGDGITIDPYFGKKIAGGYYVSGEGSYIKKIGDFYYLFISYGGLESNKGYEMRYFRCAIPDGTYVDSKGNKALYTSYMMNYGPSAASNSGNRLFGSYKLDNMNDAELAQGHNSAFVDSDGKAFLVYHTRFANGGEGHQVRVHQLYQNATGWLVSSPYEYTDGKYNQDSIESRQICSTYDIVGTYRVVMHPYRLDFANKAFQTEKTVYLHENGSVTGDYTGTWKIATIGKSYIQIKFGSTTYNGVILPQHVSGTNMEAVCFMAHNAQGVSLWGVNADGNMAVDYNYQKLKANLPVKSGKVTGNLNIEKMPVPYYGAELTWYSERPEIIDHDGMVLVNLTDDATCPQTTVNFICRFKKDNYFYDYKTIQILRYKPFEKGDANGDNYVNVNDITSIAGYILGMKLDKFYTDAADVNCDGVINVNDITAIASMILN